MPAPGERTKKKKKVRTPKGRVATRYVRGKPGKRCCGICGRVMHGMPHGKTIAEVGKLSKSEKRPTAMFAGQLCNKCRALVVDDALRVKEGFKSIDDVDLRFKNFVKQLVARME